MPTATSSREELERIARATPIQEPFKTTIDGYTFNGYEWERACSICGAYPTYFASDYDADFCPRCNEWFGAQCSHSDCYWCEDRPERPLPPGVFFVGDIEFYIRDKEWKSRQ